VTSAPALITSRFDADPPASSGFVKGHDFNRAAKPQKPPGL
jgi:hypothetical protein